MSMFCAYTIIGLKIQKSDLKVNESYINNYEKIDNVEGKININGISYRVTKVHADDDFHYILLYEGCSKEKCPFTLEQLSEMQKKMQKTLSIINLWDESKFGIFTEYYC